MFFVNGRNVSFTVTIVLCLSISASGVNRIPIKYRRKTSFSDTNKMTKRLQEMVIDHIEFDEVAVSTIFNYLKQRSRQLDKSGTGVNFIILKSTKKKTAEEPRLTLDVDKMPLYNLIDYICKVTEYKFRIESHGVLIAPPGVPLKTMQTRTFTIAPETVQTTLDFRKKAK